jgi:hypothetical protein
MTDSIEEFEYKNTNWKKVLSYLVEIAPHGYGRGKDGYSEQHPLSKKFKLKPGDLSSIMIFLNELGLIEYTDSDNNWVQVTSKGFDVVIQIQESHKSSRFNRSTLLLSFAICFCSITQLFLSIENMLEKWLTTGLFSITIIFVGIIIYKKY